MILASWAVEDRLPYLPAASGLYVEAGDDTAEVALLSGLPEPGVRRRIELGNRPYVARLNGDAVAVGWVARGLAHIGELGLSFRLPARDRLVADFEALGRCRRQDLYAWFLEGVILREEASRFWITYPAADLAASMGASATGFSEVGELSYQPGSGAVIKPAGPFERVLVAADIMGLRIASRGTAGAEIHGGFGPRVGSVKLPGTAIALRAGGRRCAPAA